MLRQLLNRNLYLVLGTDLLVFSLALILSFWIRFDFEPEAQYLVKMWALFPVMVPVKIAVMFIFGLYQGMWRYTDIRDSWALLKAVVIAEITSIALLYMLGYFSGFPRSIFLIDGVLSFVLPVECGWPSGRFICTGEIFQLVPCCPEKSMPGGVVTCTGS
jgi:FlaA1/EpsC-like NDP-sugar epimerase